MNFEKVDPNKPAFGEGSRPATPEDAPSSVPQAEEEVEVTNPEVTPAAVEEPEEPSDEGQKVPYSRFKNVNDAKLAAEAAAQRAIEEADRWKALVDAQSRTEQAAPTANTPPQWWTDLYGESEPAAQAWVIQSKANEELERRIREEAIAAVREERNQEEVLTKQSLEVIDSELEGLEAVVGRPLTDKEQSDVLDIVDEYTPKDEDGNYLGATLPFDKAWEIRQLKTQAAKAPKIAARNEVAAVSAASHQGGDVSVSPSSDKDFQSGNWGSWRSRLSS